MPHLAPATGMELPLIDLRTSGLMSGVLRGVLIGRGGTEDVWRDAAASGLDYVDVGPQEISQMHCTVQFDESGTAGLAQHEKSRNGVRYASETPLLVRTC